MLPAQPLLIFFNELFCREIVKIKRELHIMALNNPVIQKSDFLRCVLERHAANCILDFFFVQGNLVKSGTYVLANAQQP